MCGIKVLDVRNSRVKIRVLNVIFEFVALNSGKPRVLSRYKEGVQAVDRAQLWVPDHMYFAAYRQAAAILRSRR